MWHGGDGHSAAEALRHECNEGDGLGPYGWVEHDGRSYGKQDIEDKNTGIRLVTSMVKPAQLAQHSSSLPVDGGAADGGLARWLSLETYGNSDPLLQRPTVLSLVSLRAGCENQLKLVCRWPSVVTCMLFGHTEHDRFATARTSL